MKARVRLRPTTPTPNPFARVARIIAKGEPSPEWIVRGLEQFSDMVGRRSSLRPKQAERALAETHEAAKALMRYLPLYQHLPTGFGCPDEVTVVLGALPKIVKDLERVNRKKPSGRPLDVRREICAAVIVEIWKLIHGEAEPRSEQLQQACNEYWRACGGEQIGDTEDPENWRRTAKRASDGANEGWVRSILVAVQNPP
jgi:hypothetical protein